MSFIVTGLDPQPFQHLFAQSDEQLAAQHISRVRSDAEIGFPCRIALDDVQPGGELLLLNYQHQAADSPYQSAHAIFVSKDATRTQTRDVLPPALLRRLLSLRAFDEKGMMTDAVIVKGDDAVPEIERMLGDESTQYIHAHYATRGCFGATITRPE
jgi:hypothetical protein